jgi:hypothetical protein
MATKKVHQFTAIHHERCRCGHCRCQHISGFAECGKCTACIRYTWPGPGADLPPNHPGAISGAGR